MKLSWKIIAAVFLVILALGAALFASYSTIQLRSYAAIEQEDTRLHLRRTANGLAAVLRQLDSKVSDWAHWDELVAYMNGDAPEIAADNVNTLAMQSLQLDVLLIVDTQSTIRYAMGYDHHKMHSAPVSSAWPEVFANHPSLFKFADVTQKVSGIVALPEGLMLFAASPILNSQGDPPAHGFVVMGNFLDTDLVEELSATVELPLSFYRLHDPQMPGYVQTAVQTLTPAAPFAVRTVDDATIAGYTLLSDIDGQPRLVLGLEQPRSIYQQGKDSLFNFLVVLLLIGLVLGIVIWAVMRQLVLRPLAQLQVGVERLASGELTYQIPMRQRDEIGQLAAAFNAMARRLHEHEQQLQAATHAKSEFLAKMSHELRTPLNAIIGMTELLRDTSLSAEQQDYITTIHSGGKALLTLISDILDYSKIDSDKLELECRPFDLHHCVEETLQLFAAAAVAKGIELAGSLDATVPPVIAGDEARLRQILLNLLGNALKFTEHGEIIVTVTGQPQDATHTTLQFAVRDTGIGIPADRMDRLFHLFTQVEAYTTRRYGGTGLGLAISKRLCELMGGTMWVDSAGIPGQGSTFYFTLPAITPVTTPVDSPSPQCAGQSPLPAGKRVLIVDDNASLRRILAEQLANWRLQPVTATTPQEALAWIQRGDPFDVALIDAQMPELDGLALSAAIRDLRPPALLPILLMVQVGQAPDAARLAAIQPAATLLKPVKPSLLRAALAEAISGRPQTKLAGSSELDAAMGAMLPMRILVAEDNRVNQKVLLRVLEKLGYAAAAAGNGYEVLTALRAGHYDLVFMDVQMPDMDGITATQRIVAEWPAAERPIIVAMTANATQEDRAQCFAAGMDGYLSKPVALEQLKKTLLYWGHQLKRTEECPRDGLPNFA